MFTGLVERAEERRTNKNIVHSFILFIVRKYKQKEQKEKKTERKKNKHKKKQRRGNDLKQRTKKYLADGIVSYFRSL
jgi:hypothetical protein